MRRMLALSISLSFASLVFAPIHAQEPVADSDKAVLAIDVYLDRLTGSDVAKQTGMDDLASKMPPGSQESLNLDEVRRIYAAVSAPADLAVLESLQGNDPLPMNFFMRVQFKSEAEAQKTFQGMADKSKKETLGGKEYYRPPDDEGETPSNLLMHMVSPDVMEIGTEGFVLQSSRYLFTDNLLASWKKMPAAGIRIAADLEGASHLIDQGMQAAQAGGGVPPQAMIALGLVKDIGGIRLALDFSSENMLWLTLSGKDATGTGTIKNTLDGFLALAKGQGQQMLPAIPSEKMQGVAGALLGALATTQDGNDVNLVLPRPVGFEEAIVEVVPMAMAAAMGGMGPGGPGADFEAPPGDGGDAFGAPPAAGEDPFGAAPQPAAADDDPFGN